MTNFGERPVVWPDRAGASIYPLVIVLYPSLNQLKEIRHRTLVLVATLLKRPDAHQPS